MLNVYIISVVCLFPCLSDDNFRKPWHRKFIFLHAVYLQRIRVKFLYEGHRITVKVTGAKKRRRGLHVAWGGGGQIFRIGTVRYAEGLTHAHTWASYSALYRFGRLSPGVLGYGRLNGMTAILNVLSRVKLTFSINSSRHSVPHLFGWISRIFITISGLNCSSVFLLFRSSSFLFNSCDRLSWFYQLLNCMFNPCTFLPFLFFLTECHKLLILLYATCHVVYHFYLVHHTFISVFLHSEVRVGVYFA